MAAPRRQYGLILPKKAQQLQRPILQKPSVFDNDSDEETSVSDCLQKEAFKKQVMKQTKLEIQKALAEDATVYEYDSIYDDMQRKKEESNPKVLSVKDRKPKYIHSLLKAVEIRKKEQEKRMEKKIQREREMEKGEFDDKEAFVTSAYKKKLEERAEEAERERRAAALEARLDVTKQKDLSGFYRHLLNQTVGEEEVPKCSLREASSRIKEEKPRGYSDECNPDGGVRDDRARPETKVKEEENPDADSDLEESSEEEGNKASRGCRHSSSSGEDRGPSNRSCRTGGSDPAGGDRAVRRRDQRSPDSARQKEKAKKYKPREDSGKDHVRKRREPDERGGGKGEERRTEAREQRREDGGEKRASRDQEREPARRRNNGDPQDSPERVGGRGCAEGRADRPERSRDKEPGLGPSESEGSAGPGVQDGLPRGDAEGASKRQQEEGAEKPREALSKFAKRSSQETVMSARDRYLARQVARCAAKSYIEKEED
ncbi:nuclear speckle splicing regulatory protein 1 isoform X1 [Sarcophilus harrisii]|uniref:Nuclear speckle splicing regulatory protein 1 n=2 Tax=Sarcophilus harrisii TaxID=9305 RepID=A0A7N4P074_SARHA|nr:nuclear speckle splicing regulatory protein 1 isoform X1 [Sarcophilus harrisii]